MAKAKLPRLKRSIVAVLLIILLALCYAFIARPLLREMGATTYGPLSSHSKDVVLDEAEALLAEVQPMSELSDDGLRFVAMPSFGKRWMAVSLSKSNDHVNGQLAVLDRETGLVSERAFRLSTTDYQELTSRWDEQTENYWGNLSLSYDGTPLGFERKRGGVIRAALGNSPCHYDALGDLAALYIGPLASELNDLRAPNIPELLKSGRC